MSPDAQKLFQDKWQEKYKANALDRWATHTLSSSQQNKIENSEGDLYTVRLLAKLFGGDEKVAIIHETTKNLMEGLSGGESLDLERVKRYLQAKADKYGVKTDISIFRRIEYYVF
ncbi:MAG: hypothetical protein SFT91_02305 [Rickettsiaceae bacterium]|nr:hypothetical protein [Rickettsiaceae bacterium]